MKKKSLLIIGTIFIVCVSAAINLNISLTASNDYLIHINTEALAVGEDGGGDGCGGQGTVVCNGVAKYYGKYE